MNKTYREWSPDQAYMFPPSPRDWLPEGDLVYFIAETVATLDLAPIFAHYERELRGQPPFHPRMMVALLLYCYATGTRSSRKIMRRCQTDVACRIIVGEDVPDFRTISDFRKIGIHSLRKTAINDATRNGATMHEVREFAGHTDIRTTELCFVRNEEDAEVAARRIHIRVTGRTGA